MDTKAKCLALAKEHGLEIELDLRRWYHEVNLPEGYQLEDGDDRTGLCMSLKAFATKEQIYKSLWLDLEQIIRYKPWFKIPEEWK